MERDDEGGDLLIKECKAPTDGFRKVVTLAKAMKTLAFERERKMMTAGGNCLCGHSQ
jgi:hypothetical protein